MGGDAMTTQNQECCPRFNPIPWDNQVFTWEKKRFIKDKVFTLFYVPVNFGRVITRMMGKLEKAGAECPDSLCLSDHTSKWNMDIYLAVDKEVSGAENVTLRGKYLSKVYEGDFKHTAVWGQDFEGIVKDKGFTVRKLYMWYTTCPKCAKKYGKNYVVFIAEVE